MPNDKKTVSKTAAPLKSIVKEASLHVFGCVGDTLQLETENPCSSEWTLYSWSLNKKCNDIFSGLPLPNWSPETHHLR